MDESRRVGVFGGTFDPIHFGHLNLALQLKEICALDEVIFIPAGLSPFKEKTPPCASPQQRLEMLKRAIAPFSGFRILDWELQQKGVCYTIETVKKLSEDPALKLHLLLSDDQISQFYLWKDAQNLARMAPPLIGTRIGGETLEIPGARKVKIPILEISSTDIRRRLREKKNCSCFLPSSVLDYIKDLHLYYPSSNV